MAEVDKHTQKIIDEIESKRKQISNNCTMLVQDIGLNPDPSIMLALRLEVVLRKIVGVIELGEGQEFVGGDIDRMRFEVEYQQEVETFLRELKVQSDAIKARGKLFVPGDGGIQPPPMPGVFDPRNG